MVSLQVSEARSLNAWAQTEHQSQSAIVDNSTKAYSNALDPRAVDAIFAAYGQSVPPYRFFFGTLSPEAKENPGIQQQARVIDGMAKSLAQDSRVLEARRITSEMARASETREKDMVGLTSAPISQAPKLESKAGNDDYLIVRNLE